MKHTLAITGLVNDQRHRTSFAADACAADGSAIWQFQQEQLALAGIAEDGLGAPSQVVPAQDISPSLEEQGHLISAATVWVMGAMAARFPALEFVVFYEAPWQAVDDLVKRDSERFLQQPELCLQSWTSYYKEVLRLRRVLGTRLTLLNAHYEHAALPAVRAHLQALMQMPIEGQLLAVVEDAEADKVLDPGLSFMLANTMSSLAPECWDVYEALESCAQLFGREPEYRQALQVPQAASMHRILQAWIAPQHLQAQLQLAQQGAAQALEGERQKHMQDVQFLKQKAEQELAAYKYEAEQAIQDLRQKMQEEMNSLQDSNEKTVAQVQMHARRDAESLKIRADQDFAIIQTNWHIAQKQLEHVKAEAEKEKSVAQAEIQKQLAMIQQVEQVSQELRAQLAVNEAEGELKLAQLHDCQSTLERSVQQTQTMRDELTAARGECADLQQRIRQMQSKYSDLQTAAKLNVLANQELTQQLRDEEAESNQLLSLLHKTQEQLEQQVLEQQTLHTLLGQAQQSFTRARVIIAQFMQAKEISTQDCLPVA